MGVQNVFDGKMNWCDFSESTGMKINDIVHKSQIVIDEENSAPATDAVFPPNGAIHFKCNLPFMFIIYNQNSEEILFAGIYRGPN